MSKDTFILHECEKEKMDQLRELAGREDGRQEKQKEVVLNIYKDNVSTEIISQYTNLTLEEVEKIINNSNN